MAGNQGTGFSNEVRDCQGGLIFALVATIGIGIQDQSDAAIAQQLQLLEGEEHSLILIPRMSCAIPGPPG